MGKAVCNKTHNRAKEEEAVVKSFFSVLSRWAVCCLAAVPSVNITTPRYYRPPASQPGSGGRGIKLSARIKCGPPPPHAGNQISCGCFLLTFRHQSWVFFLCVGRRWDGRWSDDSHPSSVVAASRLRVPQEVVFCFMLRTRVPV